VKPAPFDYHAPESVADVVTLLGEYGDDAKVLAGGQSLVPMLNFRFARPSTLVDVMRIPALHGIERANGHLAIGAVVSQVVAERSPVVMSDCPLMGQALRHVGHIQVRTRGTVGGSLAHADPAAELPAVAVALDATMVVRSPAGERLIPACDFFLGPYTTALAEDELLVSVRFPVLDRARTAFMEHARRTGDFADAAVAVAITMAADGQTVGSARLAATGVGSRPLRLAALEERLTGAPLSEDAVDAAAREVSLDGEHLDDDTRAYKAAVLRTLVSRGLRRVMA
jgi:carbon-monoxide dehydrogenase medium subunit